MPRTAPSCLDCRRPFAVPSNDVVDVEGGNEEGGLGRGMVIGQDPGGIWNCQRLFAVPSSDVVDVEGGNEEGGLRTRDGDRTRSRWNSEYCQQPFAVPSSDVVDVEGGNEEGGLRTRARSGWNLERGARTTPRIAPSYLDCWRSFAVLSGDVVDVEGKEEGRGKPPLTKHWMISRGGYGKCRAVGVRHTLFHVPSIQIILEPALPADVPLQKYLESSFDIICSLSPQLALRILRGMSVKEVVRAGLVSKKWYAASRHLASWRWHCLRLTVNDLVRVRAPARPEGCSPFFPSSSQPSLYARTPSTVPSTTVNQTLHMRSRRTQREGLKTRRGIKEAANLFSLIIGGEETPIVDQGSSPLASDVKASSQAPITRRFGSGYGNGRVRFHDVGRVHLFFPVASTTRRAPQRYLRRRNLVSAGAHKVLVCWDWLAGTKIVRFGQQATINIGVQIVKGVSEMEGEWVVGVTIDGIVRVFSIKRREMISQFKLSELGGGDPVLSAKLFNVGSASNNTLQWFAAKGSQMTCATKFVILHLQWNEGEDEKSPNESTTMNSTLSGRTLTSPTPSSLNPCSSTVSPIARPGQMSTPQRRQSALGVSTSSLPKSPLSLGTPIMPFSSSLSSAAGADGFAIRFGRAAILTAPPKLVALVETPDVAVGAVDPRKRRVVTATSFSSRAGADRRVLMSTHEDKANDFDFDHDGLANEDTEKDSDAGPLMDCANPLYSSPAPSVDINANIIPLAGAWAALANATSDRDVKGLLGPLPPKFTGLAVPEKNPMSMQLTHEEVVVGCADGTIYVMNFLGHEYVKEKTREMEDQNYEDEEEESSDEGNVSVDRSFILGA
ncbi:hypothetical protein M405DRAFT_884194 [Rhizopogon salebrosus TDB-379]|nr:hypothetical protein M405DRAFT_884194 [Rhizopogon salebrosus TDB-379]